MYFIQNKDASSKINVLTGLGEVDLEAVFVYFFLTFCVMSCIALTLALSLVTFVLRAKVTDDAVAVVVVAGVDVAVETMAVLVVLELLLDFGVLAIVVDFGVLLLTGLDEGVNFGVEGGLFTVGLVACFGVSGAGVDVAVVLAGCACSLRNIRSLRRRFHSSSRNVGASFFSSTCMKISFKSKALLA